MNRRALKCLSNVAMVALASLPLLAACGDTVMPTDDLSTNPVDMTVATVDSAVPADMTALPDLTRPADLVTTADLVGLPDMVTLADMVALPDMVKPPVGLVFIDDYGPGVSFAPFGGSTNDVTIDKVEKHAGTASLKIVVPNAGYTGGAFKGGALADLSGFTAVTFWAKASKAATIDTFGLGNNATTTKYQAETHAVMITANWTKYTLPIPAPGKLTAEDGLFHFAQGGNGPYTLWLDDIQYENAMVGPAAPAIATETVNKAVGDSFDVNGTAATWMIGGAPVNEAVSRPYFTWASSAPQFATVDANGKVVAVAVGAAKITAKLGAIDAAGTTTVNVAAPAAPGAAPARPALAANLVISLLSNAYVNVPVDTWSAVWDQADVLDVKIGGDDMKKYTNLVFAGIEFTGKVIDATTMTHFHMDIWTPDSNVFKVKLVDFGADGKFAGGDDVEHELTFDANSNPKLVTQGWVSLELPLANFVNLKTRAHLAQLIIVGSSSTVFVDNVYFHK